MSTMKRARRLAVLASAWAVALMVWGCGTEHDLSPANLKLEIRSGRYVYGPWDDFSGTLTFTNKTRRRIDAEFPSLGQYRIDFYDSTGVRQRMVFPGAQYPAVSHLELEPLGTRVETLDFPLSCDEDTIPLGPYRVRAWVELHEDIYSETTIEVR